MNSKHVNNFLRCEMSVECFFVDMARNLFLAAIFHLDNALCGLHEGNEFLNVFSCHKILYL